MKILALTRYDRLGSSSRLRTLQYLPFLRAAGVEVDVTFLLDNDYLRSFNGKKTINKWPIICAYLKRVQQLLRSKKYHLLWIEKELFPWLPATAEKMLHRLKIPYAVDYDDAVFHSYDQHPNHLVRLMLGKKIDHVMRKAALVVAGNEYLANRAKLAGADNVVIIPTVIDIERYRLQAPNENESEYLTIGWIGSSSTYPLLQDLAPVLTTILKKYNARLLIVGAKGEGFSGLPVEWLEWSEDTEVHLIQRMSIGIMPLRNTPFCLGKCGYKLIQYMACARPVIASPVGVNSQIVNNGVNGFLAENAQQWHEAFEQLLSDAQLRQKMGRQGRLLVEQKYCTQITAPVLIDFLKNAQHKQRASHD